METESEEYHSRNNTESDIEVPEKGLVVIEDVNVVRLFQDEEVDTGSGFKPLTFLSPTFLPP